MKVSLICPSYSQGLQDYTYNLSKGLDSTAVSFQVLVNDDFSWLEEAANTRPIFTGTRPKMIINLIKQLSAYRPDIVHSQTTNLPLLATLLVLREVLDYDLVLTPHSSKSHWKRPLYERCQAHIYNCFEGVIWHTKQDREKMEAAGVITEQTVIPHGNYSFYADSSGNEGGIDAREQLELPDDEILFLFFGYVRPDKRLDLLLTSFAALNDDLREKASIMIAGEPVSGFNEYEEMISELELEDDVYSWPEFIDEEHLPLFFQAADVVVTPYDTISESGIVHIASGFGKPLIATETEGFKERLEHGTNGILFEPGSVAGLQEALGHAITNKDQMREFGKNNRRESMRNSWSDIAEETVEFYRRLANQ